MPYFRTALLLAVMTALFVAVGWVIGGAQGMAVAFLLALGMNLFALWNSDRMVLSLYRAREVDARSAPEFVGIVEELAQRAGLPMPRTYIVENPQPNAFATGRSPSKAAVCATTGLLQLLDRHGIPPSRVALVAHHCPKPVSDAWAKAIAPAEMLTTIDRFGDTTMAAIPITLATCIDRVNADYLAMLAVGIGSHFSVLVAKRRDEEG